MPQKPVQIIKPVLCVKAPSLCSSLGSRLFRGRKPPIGHWKPKGALKTAKVRNMNPNNLMSLAALASCE